MAQAGTITQSQDNFRNFAITITGLTNGSTSPTFRSRGFPIGSWTSQGTFGTSGSVQLEGSNDGGTTFFLIGTANTQAGINALIGANNLVPALYRFNCTAGDGTTNLTLHVYLMSTFG